MPNILDANGLQVSTREELLTFYTTKYQEIYGADINLDSDTPDGQWMNIQMQAVLDLQDLVVQIFNSMNPDEAIGNVLDQRVSYNGIQRQAGTYTVTNITLVNSQSVNLYGLDQDDQEVYAVGDNAGNRWLLQETQLGVSAGSHVYSFRAATPGANLTTPNTINVQLTIVLGVVSVNNPTIYTSLGINEESDALLKIRRQKSVSLASQGYLQGLIAALENINGVTSAFVYENYTDATDSDGVPSHSIWVIVAGTAPDEDIAQAIYTKRNAGCGMFGDETYDIIQIDGTVFTVYWDEVVARNLFIKFTATSIDGVIPPNVDAIRSQLPTVFIPGVFAEVNINQLATLVQQIDGNTLVTNAGFSTGEAQTLILDGTPASGTFKVNYNGVLSAAINWNDAIGAIQTKIQNITGLSAALVTGSLASHSLVFDFSGVGAVEALIFVEDNSLQTSGPVAITFAYYVPYSNVLTPGSKQYQFFVSSEDIVITPIILLPATSSVESADEIQFSAYGGYGDLVYSISVNASGASIDASTGLYTAGPGTGSDTVLASDDYGNSVTATVTVT